jgi:hypothetical protein
MSTKADPLREVVDRRDVYLFVVDVSRRETAKSGEGEWRSGAGQRAVASVQKITPEEEDKSRYVLL